jgi:hypothetical protein
MISSIPIPALLIARLQCAMLSTNMAIFELELKPRFRPVGREQTRFATIVCNLAKLGMPNR